MITYSLNRNNAPYLKQLVRATPHVYVEVMGLHDCVWARITKVEAKFIIETADGAGLEVIHGQDSDGDPYLLFSKQLEGRIDGE